MNKNTLLKIINPILAIVLLFQLITGLLHGIIPRAPFETIHGSGAGVLILFIIIHLVLNWNWVNVNFLNQKNKLDSSP